MEISFKITTSESTTETTLCHQTTYVIGRRSGDIALHDVKCSRRHLSLSQGADGQVWMKDLNSTNGTKVNGEKTTSSPLKVGDVITIGKVTLAVTRLVLEEKTASRTEIFPDIKPEAPIRMEDYRSKRKKTG